MTGFWGAFCQFEEQPCSSFPCKNGGRCSSFRGELKCKCQNNFVGPDCGKYRFRKKNPHEFKVRKVSPNLYLFNIYSSVYNNNNNTNNHNTCMIAKENWISSAKLFPGCFYRFLFCTE